MLQIRDKFVGTLMVEKEIAGMGNAVKYMKDFMNPDDDLVVEEIKSNAGWYLLFIVDPNGDQIDLYGFLTP